ncbi:MAG: 1-deoxy-D-xylulose-5-phosphate synthase, partial [Firmicutes bacterium]|nr:1-deoxy-D-xylulose-5-phosphate synthase [Bacillota bacterium]
MLDKINSPDDVKALSAPEAEKLCAEIRDFLVESVSKTGGHLASNLGVVELTVAIHRVFDTSKDRLVFDVGHQSYVHKILTGRKEGFKKLRMEGGLSGFPKPCESVHDAFIAGHASNSISAALGMARARALLGENYEVLALIGDGALSGGLAYEGLSCLGESGEAVLVILNDNGMSISRNVGGMEELLSKLRVKPGYLRFKRGYRNVVGKVRPLYRVTHRFKEWVKGKILAENMFLQMGFDYYGPVDGHDLRHLEEILRWIGENPDGPVLLHVITKKGKGYAPAENSPDDYHGVGPFDPEIGTQSAAEESYSGVFGEELTRLAARDRHICAITAAMSAGTGLDAFAQAHPERFYDVGIAEGHAVTMAAGLAKQGALPVFAVYSSFLQRGYDMLIHDVSLLNLHVVFAVDRAGLVGQDGETHHGVFDLAYLCSVPHMAVFCPASFAELRSMLNRALYKVTGPVAIRYPRGGEGAYCEDHADEPCSVLREGGDLTLLCYGRMVNEAIDAAKALAERGVEA